MMNTKDTFVAGSPGRGIYSILDFIAWRRLNSTFLHVLQERVRPFRQARIIAPKEHGIEPRHRRPPAPPTDNDVVQQGRALHTRTPRLVGELPNVEYRIEAWCYSGEVRFQKMCQRPAKGSPQYATEDDTLNRDSRAADEKWHDGSGDISKRSRDEPTCWLIPRRHMIVPLLFGNCLTEREGQRRVTKWGSARVPHREFREPILLCCVGITIENASACDPTLGCTGGVHEYFLGVDLRPKLSCPWPAELAGEGLARPVRALPRKRRPTGCAWSAQHHPPCLSWREGACPT